MLDRSIPYYHVIMKRSAGIPILMAALPQGYSIALYEEGKAEKWAEIEAAVGEFDTVEQALQYFKSTYMPYAEDLSRRLLFVLNDQNEEVGTITSWWNWTGDRRDPAIHWFAVMPAYQGLGLGKALISACLSCLLQLEGDRELFLHTQTWSHTAIGLYLRAGFQLLQSESFGNYNNEYDKALPILQTLLPKHISELNRANA